MNGPWETLLIAWLHDPVDKAVDIRGHFSRAMRYAAMVLDREVTAAELKGHLADQLASAYERLPMPDARDHYDELGVGPEKGRLKIVHPLSAEWTEVDVDVAERDVADVLRGLADAQLPLETRFLTYGDWARSASRSGGLACFCNQPIHVARTIRSGIIWTQQQPWLGPCAEEAGQRSSVSRLDPCSRSSRRLAACAIFSPAAICFRR